VWIQDDYRKTEWTLIAGEAIYVLGEHVTLGGANAHLDLKQDVADLLNEWKKDKPFLLKQFDLDGNGEIDLSEWEMARQAARRQAEQTHRENLGQAPVHLMRKPRNRVYLIANRTPDKLVSRYRAWAWMHLAFLLIAGTIAGVTIFH
jgi:hypothetical protein